MAIHREITLADLATRIGAIEHGVVLFLEERRPFEGHCAANMDVGSFDVLLGETQRREHLEREIVELFIGELQHVLAEVFAQRPLVESELDVECAFESSIQGFDLLVGEALGLQRRRVDARSLIDVAVTDSIGFDFSNLAFRITERAECFRYSAIDDLEVTTASELLELHQRKIRLDAGRVAVHDEADRAGRRDDGGLCIAVAMLFAKFQRLVPGSTCMGNHILIRAILGNQCNRIDSKSFITFRLAMGCEAVVANDAQHMPGVWLIAREGSEFLCHFSGGGIGHTGHDRRQRATNCTAFVGVIRNTGSHQQAANIGVAEAERAVFIRKTGDFLRRELRHHHRDFENDGPQACRVLVSRNIE